MRSLTLLLAAAGLAAGHELATDYGRARTLETTSELALDLETTLFEMTVNGEPVEGRGGPGGGGSSLIRKAVIVDEIAAGAKASASKVKRTFATLHDESTFSFGEEERTDERDFPLAGVTLALTRNEQGEVEAELVEGTQPDDSALLEGHLPESALDALLPAVAVEVDGTWKLEHEAIRAALATALDARLFAEPPREEGGGRGGERGERGPGRGRGMRGGPARSLGSLTWKGEAKLVALDEDHEGVECARIELTLEGEGELPEFGRGGPPRDFALLPAAAPALAGTITARLEGALYLSLAEAHPVALALDGEVAIESSSERERDGEVFATRSRQEGKLTLNVSVASR